ncbi:MAG: pseudouridine synthase, partial [Thermoproteota archaeon]
YDELDEARYGDKEIILRGATPLLFLYEGELWFPTLYFLLENPETKRRVTIDMGGVKAVSGGANVMAPGVVACDEEVKKGEGVWVAEERYGRALAVGIALMERDEMVVGRQGVAVKNIHHVGDKIWEIKED